MANLIVRNVDERIVRALKSRAGKHSRSAEAEHRAILEETLKPPATDFWEEAAKFREEQRKKGQKFDSTQIIRKSRDEGWS
mgnify:CR=1 FL=1